MGSCPQVGGQRPQHLAYQIQLVLYNSIAHGLLYRPLANAFGCHTLSALSKAIDTQRVECAWFTHGKGQHVQEKYDEKTVVGLRLKTIDPSFDPSARCV